MHSRGDSQELADNVQQCTSTNQQQPQQQQQQQFNRLSIQTQPSNNRATSFELGDLRNPSLIVEDVDSFGRSQSFDNRSPLVTITSPRNDRKTQFKNQLQQQHRTSKEKLSTSECSSIMTQSNNLSINVPYIQSANVSNSIQHKSGRRSVPNITNYGSSDVDNPTTGSSVSSNQITVNTDENDRDHRYPSSLMKNSKSHCKITNPSAIQVSIHPPPLSPSPPPTSTTLKSQTPSSNQSPRSSSPRRSPTKTIKSNINRPLPPLPPQSDSNIPEGYQIH
ncbi:hypothetical protein QR98_0031220 [Sarcoptes scabiei]|uniref:Uncharacterized protein n=1 Tax=Sarcoptes scabiei TaxID=52283 RepID=A0A132A179_SARSC|nr:hypothetical protein QR98_0031220 [Sarcoptes scabiei]